MTTNLGDIHSAALYINNVLVSKGYVRDDERLVLTSQDNDDTETDETSQETINDARIINAFYALLSTIDSDTTSNERAIRHVEELKKEQERDSQQRERLQAQVGNMDKQIKSLQQLNSTLELSLKQSERTNQTLREESGKMKNTLKQVRQQFATELRKRDIQASRLKDRVANTSSRRTKTLSGVNGTLSKTFNSYSTNAVSKVPSPDNTTRLEDEVVAKNRTLIQENNTLHDLLIQISDSVAGMTSFIEEPKNEAGVVSKSTDSQALGDDIAKTIQKISEVLNSPNFVSLNELQDKQAEVDTLKQKLKDTTEAWEKANKTIEEWKNYKQKRDQRGKPRVEPPKPTTPRKAGKPSLSSTNFKENNQPDDSPRKSTSNTPRKSTVPRESSLTNPTASSATKSSLTKSSSTSRFGTRLKPRNSTARIGSPSRVSNKKEQTGSPVNTSNI